jgi:hypothetical protein
MPEEATFERMVIAGQYVILSKDLPGFQVSAPTRHEAEKMFPILLAKYMEIMSRKQDEPTVIDHVRFKELKPARA